MTPLLQEQPLSSAALAAERPRLVGLCAHLTGDVLAAEDLAQETLIEAWRHRHKLHDPTGRSRWLSAIARNVCRRWQRAHGLELARQAPESDRLPSDAQPDPRDLQDDLEQAELAALLDRSLAQLPPLTRAALVGRYILDTPLSDLAARLGLSEAAVAKRLQRGARALRAVLDADLQRKAADATAPSAAWEQTRIWCTECGNRRLLGRLPHDRASLSLRCPDCGAGRDTANIHIENPALFRGVSSFKPAFSRVLAATHRRHQDGLARSELPCVHCNRLTPLHITQIDESVVACATQSNTVLTRRCGACGTSEQTSLAVCMLALPPVQRFWRAHPRLYTLPERPVEAAGRPAVVIGFRGVTSADQIDLLAASDTGRVLALNGDPYLG